MVAGTSEPRRRSVALGRWWRSAQWYVVAGGVAVAFVLGVVGFARRFSLVGETRPISDAFYLALQLFTLESGSVAQPVPLELDVARFLAPAMAAFGAATATVALLGERFSRIRLRFARGHVVVCGLGDRGQRIAEEFVRAGHRVVVIERNEANPGIIQARECGAVVVIGDAADGQALHQARADRARYVIAVCAEDGTNAAIAVRLSALRSTCTRSEPVTAIVHVRNTELCDLLAESSALSCGADGMRLEFFNVPRSGAAAMLAELPAAPRNPDRPGAIVVVGLGRLGRSLVLQAARAWWFDHANRAEPPHFVLVDRAASASVERLRARAPRLDDACRIHTHDVEIGGPEFERGAFLLDGVAPLTIDAVYVCCEDEAEALTAALTVRRLTRAAHVPIAVRMRSNDGLASIAIAGVGDFAHLHAVGVLDATCSVSALLGGVNESTARAVHADYVRRERDAGRTVTENPSMAAWDDLPEHLRESNRRQADDIVRKLREVGMTIVPLDDWAAEPDMFTPGELEQLAIGEHDRWVRERTDLGWKYAPGPKNVERKTSPYLVGWDDLAEDIRDLDRDAVRAIPALLAAAGLTMQRTDAR